MKTGLSEAADEVPSLTFKLSKQKETCCWCPGCLPFIQSQIPPPQGIVLYTYRVGFPSLVICF